MITLNPAAFAPLLPPAYETSHAGLLPARFWQNLAATPDIPTMGEAVTAGWPLVSDGRQADGMIVIDPLGLAALLELTGPVTVADWPEPITAENAAEILLFEHYDRLDVDAIDRFQACEAARKRPD